MEYAVLKVESKLFGRKVLVLDAETTPEEYVAGLDKLIADEQPWYMNRLCEANDLSTIHAFEDLGFRFVELRMFRDLRIENMQMGSHSFFPYEAVLLDEESLPAIYEIIRGYPADDRFSRDPLIPAGTSLKRLELYMKKSITNTRNEFIYGLVNHHTGELAGFRNGEFTSKKTVRYFYRFMAPTHNTPAYASMLEAAVIDALVKRGAGMVEAITSGLNVEEINEAFSTLGFRAQKTMVLLRKIF
ncbi:MAG: hypothetical protein H6541_11940 [Lentimicrobiaceae bacterium]|nr:hypothetical protein [Lentimicrobiaceae bacterium]